MTYLFVDVSIMSNANLTFERRFPHPIDVSALSQRDFADYVREQLWDKIALERGISNFNGLPFESKQDIDLEALLRMAKAFNEVTQP